MWTKTASVVLELKLTSFRNAFTSPVSRKEALAYLITEIGHQLNNGGNFLYSKLKFKQTTKQIDVFLKPQYPQIQISQRFTRLEQHHQNTALQENEISLVKAHC